MTRAEAAPSVPDSMRSVRTTAVSSDSSPVRVRAARSTPTKRARSWRSSSMRAASAGARRGSGRGSAPSTKASACSRSRPTGRTSSETPTSSAVFTATQTRKPCNTGSSAASGSGR